MHRRTIIGIYSHAYRTDIKISGLPAAVVGDCLLDVLAYRKDARLTRQQLRDIIIPKMCERIGDKAMFTNLIPVFVVFTVLYLIIALLLQLCPCPVLSVGGPLDAIAAIWAGMDAKRALR